jgi:hypothetical protein
MKAVFVLISATALFASACSTTPKTSVDLEKRVQALEVYSLNEIEQHTQLLLETHPELTSEARAEIKALLEQSIRRWQDLRRQEAQLIQALLANTLSPEEAHLDHRESEDQLKQMLQRVYEQKHKDTLALVEKVTALGNKKLVDKRLQKDLNLILREFR